MTEIWLRAYGGTGGLMARAFIDLLMISPLKDKTKKVVVQLMDYDELPPANAAIGNDLSILNDLVTCYNALHELKINGLAENPVSIESGQLKGIREKAYEISAEEAATFDYSLNSLFGPTTCKILSSCLSKEQIVAANMSGAYGDLARNAIIAKALEVSGAFDPTYHDFDQNNTIVMYLGSTDGGVGNTLLDPDLYALCNYISKNAWPVDKNRNYRIYSFRTLPYKKFKWENNDALKAANAKRILEEMVPQSMGVIGNLETRTDYVRTGNIQTGVAYKLDGLFLAGYAVTGRAQFDDTNAPGTNEQSNPDSQTHLSHAAEVVSALMMVDCLNDDIYMSSDTRKLVYGYDVEPAPNTTVLQKNVLLSDFTTPFKQIMFKDREDSTLNVTLSQKLRAAVDSYAFMLKLQHDFKSVKKHPADYRLTRKLIELSGHTPLEDVLMDMYGVQKIGGGVVNTDQIGAFADKMSAYLDAMQKLTRLIYEMQEVTRFGSPNSYTVDLLPHEGLRVLLEPRANETYYYSKNNLWEPNSNDDDYEDMLVELNDCPELDRIIFDENNNERRFDAAFRMLVNAVYELFLRKAMR